MDELHLRSAHTGRVWLVPPERVCTLLLPVDVVSDTEYLVEHSDAAIEAWLAGHVEGASAELLLEVVQVPRSQRCRGACNR